MDDATILETIFSHSVPQLFGSTIAIILVVAMLMLLDWSMESFINWSSHFISAFFGAVEGFK